MAGGSESEDCVVFVAGTRPEIIKVAPVVKLARKRLADVKLVLTGQHREMADQALSAFSLRPDLEMDLHRKGTGLGELASSLVKGLEEVFTELQPEILVVQGDTSSAALAGLVANYLGIPVAHIEAGLRSHDKDNPFPEEINRRVLGVCADLNFAPTALAAENLRAEGVAPESIITTGNTVVDALEMVKAKLTSRPAGAIRRVLVTAHRRESWDRGIRKICSALKDLALANSDVEFVFSAHHNPVVHDQVQNELAKVSSINLREPLGYMELLSELSASYLVLTDSGGIQEEAPSFGVPVVVLREVTERPEAVRAGQAVVVGTSQEAIVGQAQKILDDGELHAKMARKENPFGDGRASVRIIKVIQNFLEGRTPAMEGVDQFPG